MIQVETINEQEEREITEKEIQLIEAVIQEAAKVENITNGEVVITLVDDEKIHQLNLEYRGVDRPTDVLSFAMNEQGEDEFEIIYDDQDNELPNILGDIIISIPRVIKQAIEYGHSFERELGFLTVHGFLHLIGYDHLTDEEEKVMFAKQEQILGNLKLLR
ncbi:rRNA maturation RNase YbeY [Vulcanibacillus modesticaldus]|uniref:Endoribonuclease YbeY n=1 Tax=Vulcanibacillus modesticaldus TaxID=337097 RepID=A0A1D2YVT2_9BACI|nr:rRNA maturation RNase YbeY [Vulcanibacillus modesticaldus]OEF99725.1 rRNA maturation RNase YbeY [Vulcanibacillus modesticaldus]